MEQYGNNSIQSTVQLAVAFGRLHDLASQVVNLNPRERDDTATVSRDAFNRLQDHLELIEQQFGLPREQEAQGRQRGPQDQEWQGRQRGQERQSQTGSRDTH